MAYSSKKTSQTRGYQPPVNEQERFLVKRAKEMALAAFYGRVRTTGFLSEREQQLVQEGVNQAQGNVAFYGGYPQAQRKMALFSSNENMGTEQYVIALMEIKPQAGHHKALTHRDYMGSVLGLGIERDCVGDFLMQEQGVLCYVQEQIVPLLEQELIQVGRVSVTCRKIDQAETPALQLQMQEKTAFVASLRVDAVLTTLLHISRAKAASLIQAGQVSINDILVLKTHETLFEQDIIRVRGYGKFCFKEIGKQSKKGRTFITYCQFM